MKKSTRYKIRDTSRENGSALILAVVLTSLLAIVGVLFVMAARVDKIAASAISENKDLDFAVDTVVAKISRELTLDVPGMPAQADPNQIEEYYDYPDSRNPWLASLEPNDGRMWPQISNVTGTDVGRVNLSATIIPDYQPVVDMKLPADADGDGVSDSVWIELPDITSSKGRPIFAAIRIIDNGGMINVNTAYKFDYDSLLVGMVDGSSQMQINLMALSWRPGTKDYDPLDAADLLRARAGSADPLNLNAYERNVVWRYGQPNGLYTPFDISDELELRSRFLLNHEDIRTRIENLWTWSFNSPTELHTPVDTGGIELDRWFYRSQHDVLGPNDIYSYRHIATTYNMDRIIDPIGPIWYNGEIISNGRMFNVNAASVANKYALRNTITRALLGGNPTFPAVSSAASQITANLIDFVDSDANVTVVDDIDGILHYGFERPCVYISELAYNSITDANGQPHRSYAIELYKPYPDDGDPCGWQLVIDNPARTIPIDWSGTRQFHVVAWQNPAAPLVIDFNDPCDPNASANVINISDVNAVFAAGSIIELWRPVADVNIVVDSVPVPAWLVTDSNEILSFQRDITLHKCIRRLWAAGTEPNSTLGSMNTYKKNDSIYIQAHPYLDPVIYGDKGFKNIGEIGMVFCKSAYSQGPYPIGPDDTEATARLNFADPNFQQIFNYLTVFDPTVDGIDNDGDGYGLDATLDPKELKIPGRININTAPWFVIAQLPWVSPQLAQAIVAYRDKLKLLDGVVDYSASRARGMWDLVDQPPPPISVREAPGFASVGELLNVTHALIEGGVFYSPLYDIRRYGRGNGDQRGFPDLTTNPPQTGIDGAPDDFEERDLIFARISNLVTVRSDVFTAYILVRIGADGPQKRVIAILDRSDVYPDGKGGVIGRVKVRALYPVPDPR